MFDDKTIMKYETTLPEDFSGTFHFTNWSNDEFIGRWGNKQYHFPAETTSPMVIPEHSPLEVQHIRKKFAKDLAEREFYKSQNYKNLMKQERNPDGSARLNGLHAAGTYSIDQLTPFIQKCLEPLPIAKALVKAVDAPSLEENLSRNNKGKLNTEAIDGNDSLVEKARNL
jgi:hypothetical protein